MMLPFDQYQACAAQYEQLKSKVADGDYVKYREWYLENEPAVRDIVDGMVADAFRGMCCWPHLTKIAA